MYKIEDGREHFVQWDTYRRLIIDDADINEVHFCNRSSNCSLVCEVYEESGKRYANVPNLILQEALPIKVYGSCGEYTKEIGTYNVLSRTKPADYIYTETEVRRWEDNENRIEQLEKDTDNMKKSVAKVENTVKTKLDKVTTASDKTRLYGVNGNGDNKLYSIASAPLASTIVWRDNEGRTSFEAPKTAKHAVNKEYVDKAIGNVETALDRIIAIQEALIGGTA